MGISFTEDLMPLLSTELYREFGIPYLERISGALGGLHIHCCGDFGRHAESLAAADADIRALEFHYPFTTIEELEPLSRTALLVPYYNEHAKGAFSSPAAYYAHLLESTDEQVRFWFAFPDDGEEAQAFARAYAE